MVQHKLSGPLAEEFLMTITPSALDALPKHTSTLSCLLAEDGGIVDDTVITRLGRDSFYFVTNAGCREPDLEFIQAQMDKFLSSKPKRSSSDEKPMAWHILENHSLIALQGPLAQQLLQPFIHVDPDDSHLDTDLSTLYFSHSRWLQLDIPESCTKEGTSLSTPSLLISRTGYTGEDGFEISIPPESGSSAALAQSITKALLSAKISESDAEPACRMAGLAARDSLRLEAGMCLYGHDIGLDVTPPMAGLGWTVAKSRRSDRDPKFNGREVVNEQLASPKSMKRRRVGFMIENGPAAREGAEVVALDDGGNANETIGKITSGCPSPSMEGKNIAMGYVKNGYHKKGTKVGVKVRGKVRKGEVERMPFVEAKFHRGKV